jgi:hypothetical protein
MHADTFRKQVARPNNMPCTETMQARCLRWSDCKTTAFSQQEEHTMN